MLKLRKGQKLQILQRLYLFMEHTAEFIRGAWRIHSRATFLVVNISSSFVCTLLPWIHPLHSALLEYLRSVTIRHALGISLTKEKITKLSLSRAGLLHRFLSCDSHSNCRGRPIRVLETSAGWQTYRHDFPRSESVASHDGQSIIVINDGIIHSEESDVVIFSQVAHPASFCLPHELVVNDQLQNPKPPTPYWTSHCWHIIRVLVCSDVSLASFIDSVVPSTVSPVVSYLNLIKITDVVLWHPFSANSLAGQFGVAEAVSSRENPEFVYQGASTLHVSL